MNWYKKSQELFNDESTTPKAPRIKGWKVTVKKVKLGSGLCDYMYEAHVFAAGQVIPTVVPTLFDTSEKAREGAWRWLKYKLSGKNY